MTEITYTYLDSDLHVATGAWSGDRDDALTRAVEYLGARSIGGGIYLYRSHETGASYLVTEHDLAVLGAGLIAERDVYDLWCTDIGRSYYEPNPEDWREKGNDR